MAHAKPGNQIMSISLDLGSNLLLLFDYKIFTIFIFHLLPCNSNTALHSSCPLIQEWSTHTSFTPISRDGLTNHFGTNTDAACTALFFTVELIVMSLDLFYAFHSLMRLNAHHWCKKVCSFSFDRTSTLIARKVCISQSFSPQQDLPSIALTISTCLSSSKLAAVVLLYWTLVGYKTTERWAITARASAEM